MKFPRDLAAEAEKHFKGTAGERVALALRLGEDAVDLYLAGAPAGTTRAEARRALARAKHAGRRRSAVMEWLHR